MKRIEWTLCFGILPALFAICAHAESPREPLHQPIQQMPPAAQDAIKKGLLAAKEQEWEIAIKSFQEARKSAPDAPEIFGYLGMAESKLPGRELRAIAWFGAYLAANPNAANAAAIKDAIASLQIKSEGNINRMIRAVQEADNALPDTPIRHDGGITGNLTNKADQGRMMALYDVANLWAASGNADEAIQTAQRIGAAGYNKTYSLSQIVSAQAAAGFTADAIKTAAGIDDINDSESARLSIAAAQAKVGDMAAARNSLAVAQVTAAGLQSIYIKNSHLYEIAQAQVKIGDMVGAQKSADLIPRIYLKSWAEYIIAQAQVEAGDIAGARASLSRAQADIDRWIASSVAQKTAMCDCTYDPHEESNLADLHRFIGQALTKTGDLAAARKALQVAQQYVRQIADADRRDISASEIAKAQAEAGDIDGAQATTGLITNARWKDAAIKAIIVAHAKAGNIEAARATVYQISDASARSSMNITIQLAQMDAQMEAKARSSANASHAVPPRAASAPAAKPAITVADWTSELGALDKPMFVDLIGALKAPQRTYKLLYPGSSGYDDSNNDPKKTFDALVAIAREVIDQKNKIDRMLTQQAKQETGS